MCRMCRNCKNRASENWSGYDLCIGYEMTSNENEEIETARTCPHFEKGNPYFLVKEDDCPSATNGDYSPSNPWDAPGMSIKDFI